MSEWIKWDGGERPVPAETMVQCRFGVTGETRTNPCEADCYFWQHTQSAVKGNYHITAYRIVEQDA